LAVERVTTTRGVVLVGLFTIGPSELGLFTLFDGGVVGD
jgi:hypothetical protein